MEKSQVSCGGCAQWLCAVAVRCGCGLWLLFFVPVRAPSTPWRVSPFSMPCCDRMCGLCYFVAAVTVLWPFCVCCVRAVPVLCPGGD